MAYTRDINCLKDAQKAIRLPALQRLNADLPNLSSSDLSTLFPDLRKPLLDLLSDPADKCRELTVSLLSALNGKMTEFEAVGVLEALNRRLPAENVEEIRLLEVKLVREIVEKWCETLGNAAGEVGVLVAKAFKDPFPLVKQEAASLLECLSLHFREHLSLISTPILLSSVPCLTHQHSKVRVNTLHALGTLLKATGSCDLLIPLYPVFKQKLRYDRAAAVRKTLYEVLAGCLLEYSYEALMLEVELDGKGLCRLEVQLTYLLISGLGDAEMVTTVNDLLTKVNARRVAIGREAEPQPCYIAGLEALLGLSLADCTEWTVQERSKTRGAGVLLALTTMAGPAVHPYLSTVLQTILKAYTDSEEADQRSIYEAVIAKFAQNVPLSSLFQALIRKIPAEASSPSQRTTLMVSSIQIFIRAALESAPLAALLPELQSLIAALVAAAALIMYAYRQG